MSMKRFSAFILVFLICLYPFAFVASAIPAIAGQKEAYRYLDLLFWQYHKHFYVYRNADSGGNHFIPSGWMGDVNDITFEADCSENPHSPPTCIRITYIPKGIKGWAGIFWQYPENNWGSKRGLDLSGAKRLIFWARGEKGGEKAEFKIGLGMGKDLSYSISTGIITLSKNWKKYVIPLNGVDLRNLIGGFCWVTNTVANPKGATIYLDDIQFDLRRDNTLRFLQSYEITSSEKDIPLRNTAFLYDNALALIAYIERGSAEDLKKAKLIADSFVYAQSHDRYFKDGRLRNAYQSGDLIDPLTGWARLPGWWDKKKKKWFEDKYQVSTHTGNLAWTIIALLDAYEIFQEHKYIEAALGLARWIEKNCKDNRGKGGYTGGFEGWRDKQKKILWKSTEHNLDVYVAFERLYQITKNKKWHNLALHAKRFVLSMWNQKQGHFWAGTLQDGITVNKSSIPVDIQAWAILALRDKSFSSALWWAEKNCFVKRCPVCGAVGFDFNNDRDGVWYEGTAQVALGFLFTGEREKYNNLVKLLKKAQLNSGAIPAACHDGVSTGFGWKYYKRAHLGATCWFLFALKGFNPYWNSYIPFKSYSSTRNQKVVNR